MLHKILVIEDEPAMLKNIVESLTQEQYVVEKASTYETAQEKILLYTYDCLLLDITLPGGSGLDLLAELKFTIDQPDYSVLVAAAGTITMIKQDISVTDLPPAIVDVFKKEYAAYTLDDQEKIEKGGEVNYQVELKKRLWDKNLVFTATGQKATGQTYWD